jgi:hypothetical protein
MRLSSIYGLRGDAAEHLCFHVTKYNYFGIQVCCYAFTVQSRKSIVKVAPILYGILTLEPRVRDTAQESEMNAFGNSLFHNVVFTT